MTQMKKMKRNLTQSLLMVIILWSGCNAFAKETNYDWANDVFIELNNAGFTKKEQQNIVYNLMAESKGKLIGEIGNRSTYKGRGYIQLTGKANYKYFGDKLKVDLINNPELANDPKIASKIVALFYKENLKWKKIVGNYEDFDNVVKATAPAFYKRKGDSKIRLKWLVDNKINPPEIK